MKNYRRSYPLFSLCGLNCGLCPVHHMDKGCPGCGGGEGHQSCPIVKCSLQHGSPEFCYECPCFPCERYQSITDYDSFISHKNMLNDLNKAKVLGEEAYQSILNEKIVILQHLLLHYNDGRKKTFFCTAVNLLELEDVKEVLAKLSKQANDHAALKENAALAVSLFQEAADRHGVSLKLRKKPKGRE